MVVAGMSAGLGQLCHRLTSGPTAGQGLSCGHRFPTWPEMDSTQWYQRILSALVVCEGHKQAQSLLQGSAAREHARDQSRTPGALAWP